MRADITSLFGLNVYTNQGTYVGKVNDLVFDVDERVVSGLALSDINRDIFDVTTRGVILPYRWVVTTGDIVIIRDIVKRFKRPAKEEEKED